ncbi:unnamed protein product [Nippostrongylus brasiliensis]|uniref:SCP domain-containing protein n=1 Tax=Nippostrongylus brasiliensis TaxID=27835 RepID=A0A0N4XDL4_NIPBR|nr:unnamed protein product [Nippostrongylus brasiliensis]
MLQRIVVITLLLHVFGGTVEATNFNVINCTSNISTIPNSWREAMLKAHNDASITLMDGDVPSSNGYLYRSFSQNLRRWNCITEQNLYTQLQKLTSCGDDRLIYKQFGVNNKLIERNSNSCTNLTLAAPAYWYTGSVLYPTKWGTNRFMYENRTGTPLEADFVNFIMWETTDMACAYRNCPDDNTKMIVVCAYNQKGAIISNTVYFKTGKNGPTYCIRPSNTQKECLNNIPCLENNMCDATTPNADSLDQLFDGVPVEKDGPDMDQFSRYGALQMHNYYRRTVTRGWAADGKGGYAPSAVDMPLLTYNSSLEDSAIVHANKCALALEVLGPIGQAIGQINDNTLSRIEALEKVITGWFGEIGNPGIGDDLTFTAAMDSTLTNGVRNYANMVYDQHIEVGCGTASCQTGITVVCHYQPKPGKALAVGEQIYSKGKPCSNCADTCISHTFCPTKI